MKTKTKKSKIRAPWLKGAHSINFFETEEEELIYNSLFKTAMDYFELDPLNVPDMIQLSQAIMCYVLILRILKIITEEGVVEIIRHYDEKGYKHEMKKSHPLLKELKSLQTSLMAFFKSLDMNRSKRVGKEARHDISILMSNFAKNLEKDLDK